MNQASLFDLAIRFADIGAICDQPALLALHHSAEIVLKQCEHTIL
jgi:hypothetical protein